MDKLVTEAVERVLLWIPKARRCGSIGSFPETWEENFGPIV